MSDRARQILATAVEKLVELVNTEIREFQELDRETAEAEVRRRLGEIQSDAELTADVRTVLERTEIQSGNADAPEDG